jgi:hypothetical protein
MADQCSLREVCPKVAPNLLARMHRPRHILLRPNLHNRRSRGMIQSRLILSRATVSREMTQSQLIRSRATVSREMTQSQLILSRATVSQGMIQSQLILSRATVSRGMIQSQLILSRATVSRGMIHVRLIRSQILWAILEGQSRTAVLVLLGTIHVPIWVALRLNRVR